MLAFIGPCPDGLERRHLDGKYLNDHLDNLAYGTRTENMQDRVKHGGYVNTSKTHCPANHSYDEANTYLDKNGGRSCKECGRIRQRGVHRDRRAYYRQQRANNLKES
jgi:formamidopyrimidine-DNA glycosylase